MISKIPQHRHRIDIARWRRQRCAQLKVTSITSCASGPGTAYDQIFSMNPGPIVPLVGKDTADNYWIINNPGGGTCWLSGQTPIWVEDITLA